MQNGYPNIETLESMQRIQSNAVDYYYAIRRVRIKSLILFVKTIDTGPSFNGIPVN